ncbi:hypothetical protein TWF730_003786 [Orbilia blumenaviensis]|uniref:JmjC domain-containing protein n=1 Tax=Orbilia blumenaviensis TaxID=1796055 RepID=A0AAV9U3G1_9PEZI
MPDGLTNLQWADQLSSTPPLARYTTEQVKELAAGVRSSKVSSQTLSSARQGIMEHQAIIRRYNISFRSAYGVLTPIFEPNEEQVKIGFDMMVYDALRLCGDKVPCFLLKHPPSTLRAFPDDHPERDTVSIVRYVNKSACSIQQYKDYLDENPEKKKHLGVKLYNNSPPRRKENQTLLPELDSEMWRELDTVGYRCSQNGKSTRNNADIKAWKIAAAAAVDGEDSDDIDDQQAIHALDTCARKGLGSRTLEVLGGTRLAFKLAGAPVPELENLPGCSIRALRRHGYLEALKYFCQPVLRVREQVPRPLGFGEVGSLTVQYLVAGGATMWYIANPKDNKTVKEFMCLHFGDRFVETAEGIYEDIHVKCEQKTRHLEIFVKPDLLESAGIKLHRVVQLPGECMVTFPYANFQEISLKKSMSLTSLYLPFDRIHQLQNYKGCNMACGLAQAEGGSDGIPDVRDIESVGWVDFAGAKKFSKRVKEILEHIRQTDGSARDNEREDK